MPPRETAADRRRRLADPRSSGERVEQALAAWRQYNAEPAAYSPQLFLAPERDLTDNERRLLFALQRQDMGLPPIEPRSPAEVAAARAARAPRRLAWSPGENGPGEDDDVLDLTTY